MGVFQVCRRAIRLKPLDLATRQALSASERRSGHAPCSTQGSRDSAVPLPWAAIVCIVFCPTTARFHSSHASAKLCRHAKSLHPVNLCRWPSIRGCVCFASWAVGQCIFYCLSCLLHFESLSKCENRSSVYPKSLMSSESASPKFPSVSICSLKLKGYLLVSLQFKRGLAIRFRFAWCELHLHLRMHVCSGMHACVGSTALNQAQTFR